MRYFSFFVCLISFTIMIIFSSLMLSKIAGFPSFYELNNVPFHVFYIHSIVNGHFDFFFFFFFGFCYCKNATRNMRLQLYLWDIDFFLFVLLAKVKVKVLVVQSCLTLYNPMDCSSPGSSIHGILQQRILEWVAISYSRQSLYPKVGFLDHIVVLFLTS